MKIISSRVVGFLLLMGLGIPLPLQAAVTGRASLIVRPTFGTGFYATEIRHENDKILGQTYWGPITLVNLEVKEGVYQGVAGGNGHTHLTCTSQQCEGLAAGLPANFEYALKDGILNLKGTLNHRYFESSTSAQKINVTSWGAWSLSGSGDGNFTGTGQITPHTLLAASLKTSGTLINLADPALVAIFLVAPVSGR